mmetsp:Transcript_6798/g.13548  ORF Transcript_6798/g.13548 Transcript_6798/m.13548 type:complete len:164 (+) Transcript_6798:222-713(+)
MLRASLAGTKRPLLRKTALSVQVSDCYLGEHYTRHDFRFHSKRRIITRKTAVLRSLRNVPRDHELLLRGSLTPTPKKCAGTAEDIDDLCGALSSVIITPTKKGAKLGAASSKDSEAKVVEEANSVDVSATFDGKLYADEEKKIPAKSPVQPLLPSRTRRGGTH